MGDRDHIAQALPLTHLSYHILLSLSTQNLHGYTIIKAVKETPGNKLDPGTGTFYSALRRMMEEGLITEVAPPVDDPGDQRRRYYSITDLGRGILTAETRRLEELVRFAQKQVDLAEGRT